MAKKQHSGIESKTETSFEIAGAKYSRKQETTLSNVAPSDSAPIFQSMAKAEGKLDNKTLKTFGAIAVAFTVLNGVMSFGPSATETIELALAACEAKVEVYQDVAGDAVTRINNQQLAQILDLNNNGMFKEMTVEIYGNGEAKIQTKLVDALKDASQTANLSNDATSLGDLGGSYSTPAKPSFLNRGSDLPSPLIEAMRGMSKEQIEAEALVCPITPQNEKNSCQPGDDPDDYYRDSSTFNRVG